MLIIDGKPMTPDNMKGVTIKPGGYIETRNAEGKIVRITDEKQRPSSK